MAEPSRRAWETALRKDIARIDQSVVRAMPPGNGSLGTARTPSPDDIRVATREALRILDQFHDRPWYRRMFEAGSVYDAALARVQRADEDLLLIAAPE